MSEESPTDAEIRQWVVQQMNAEKVRRDAWEKNLITLRGQLLWAFILGAGYVCYSALTEWISSLNP